MSGARANRDRRRSGAVAHQNNENNDNVNVPELDYQKSLSAEDKANEARSRAAKLSADEREQITETGCRPGCVQRPGGAYLCDHMDNCKRADVLQLREREPPGRFECNRPGCDFVAKTASTLRGHRRTRHCSEVGCNYTSSGEADLRKHKLEQHAVPVKPTKQSWCAS